MESISSSRWLMKPKEAFPMGLSTTGSSTYDGWKLDDASYFG